MPWLVFWQVWPTPGNIVQDYIPIPKTLWASKNNLGTFVLPLHRRLFHPGFSEIRMLASPSFHSLFLWSRYSMLSWVSLLHWQSYCVQNSGAPGRILLAIVLGVSMIVILVTASFFWWMRITSGDNPSSREKLPKCGLRNLVAHLGQWLLKWPQQLRKAQKSEDDPEKGESHPVL